VFHAGTAKNGQSMVTAGGRVLGITGRGRSLAEAQAAAYRASKRISFKGCHYRHDIAYRALAPRV
jgi:phosphoribosylamine---glycine ligase